MLSTRSATTLMIVVALALHTAHAQSPRASELRTAAAKEFVAAFRDTGLVPILLPRGHAPGDVIASNGEVLSRRGDCFKAVDLRDDPSRLPNVELSWSAAARFALAVDEIAEAAAHGNAENVVKVRFEGVRSVSASRLQLTKDVRSDVCPALAKALRNNAIPENDWLLIGEVLMAKPVVDLRRSKAGGANLSFLKGLAQRVGLSARAEGGADLARGSLGVNQTGRPRPAA